MNTNFEPVMNALLAHLTAATSLSFTANATASSAVLTNVSSVSGLFAGLPVFGPGVARGAAIESVNPGARTVTLSDALTAAGTAAAFTIGFQTIGRRAQLWSQVSAQPALFLRRTGTTDQYDETFGVTTLECELWIYSQSGQDPDAVPDAALSALDMLMRQSFAPDTDYGEPRFTLGGLVYWCRIEGKSDYSDGALGAQGISRIPVRITLP
jgi:hypothetical protein